MSERTRQLEDALAILQAKFSNEPHPLLASSQVTSDSVDDSVTIQEQAETTSLVFNNFGMLSVSDGGASTFFGPTGGSEYLLTDVESYGSPGEDSDLTDSNRSPTPILPDGLLRFSTAFPFTPSGSTQSIYELILSHLPPYERACALADKFLNLVAWLFTCISKEQVVDEMIPFIYRRIPDAGDSPPVPDYGGPHDLALLLFVFAIGARVDFDWEPHNADKEAEHYGQLGRAAIGLQSVWATPGVTTIQALHLSSINDAMGGNGPGEISMEMSWGTISLAAAVSQSIGLHRDCARWNLPEDVVNRRRAAFWNIFAADAWQSLGSGRPPAFSREYIDCKFPRPQTILGEEADESAFNTFFVRFAYDCVAEVVAKTLTPEPPSYETIMELDRRVRDVQISPEAIALVEGLDSPDDIDPPPVFTSMESFVKSHSREVVLLFIHRSFFAQAIIDYPQNPARSEYAHSYLAAYRASSTVLTTIRLQYDRHPILCARIWPVWTYGFSAAVVFATVATRGPKSPLASNAMSQLHVAFELFTEAARYSRRAAKALAIFLSQVVVTKLREKAHCSMTAAQPHPSRPPVIDSVSYSVKTEGDDGDELEIFAGTMRVGLAKQSQSPDVPLRQHLQTSQALSEASSSKQSSSYISAPPPQDPTLAYPVPGSSSHSSWMSQQMPVYPSPGSDHWYGQSGYPQSQDYAWNQQPSLPTSQQGSTVANPFHPQTQMGTSEGYRHHLQPYSGPHEAPSVYPAPYAPPAELVDLGLASREASLDAKWAYFMHESGFLDDVNLRT
ncbi:uncharacterized protein FIBRA_04742 [Fibroporia radiculosa]|uniref:Xylanolytic transcriptional activator regulatory domain-containing protein n=1 Tax=Fibroporia radiculosa TaxID=599839 RepID=J4G7V9_9APHY|nr:uncharacterized protein FIBRA_04742 [Fibroporia radiculosa]CCM02638.1 predicted protein [Fibroporia radiculosa]